ncbi:MAG: hypothetical protein NC343_07655 [Muribaculum sp.]|nr:hypothetical protein [Muribaculaceae bacterium]MCM1081610.1 hypothetical protein [Muribaculum sp.]
MKLQTILMSGLLAVVACSCSTVRHTASYTDVTNKVVSFTVADLEVQKEKASKTYSWSYDPFRRVSIANVKENVTAEILEEKNADVLLEPQYIVHKRGFLRGGSVTVIGIPAKYTDFHKMTAEEAAIVRDALKNDGKKAKKRWFLF